MGAWRPFFTVRPHTKMQEQTLDIDNPSFATQPQVTPIRRQVARNIAANEEVATCVTVRLVSKPRRVLMRKLRVKLRNSMSRTTCDRARHRSCEQSTHARPY